MNIFLLVKNCLEQRTINTYFGIIISICCYVIPASSQITTVANNNPTQLVQSIMGKGYTVSNAKLTCPTGAVGTFISTTSNIGLGQGIVLTTGRVSDVKGPNDNPGISFSNGGGSDPALTALSGFPTQDACALEFDLVPACDNLKINYVFGSEEYPEYVNQTYNDIFAFFISGPGITGTLNMATVPGTTTPVSINSINANRNSQYFVNNANGKTVQYDGFTKPLTATAKVIPCKQYHLRMAIADAFDGVWDSGVFIEAGSINCDAPEIISPPACANASTISLCAAAGYTYDWPAGQPGAVPPLNQQCLTINNPKAGDVYTVNLTAAGGGCPAVSKITLKGSDFSVSDTSVCPGSAKFPLIATPLTNGTYDFKWEPATNLSCTNCQNPIFDPQSSQTYTVTMSDKDVSNCNRVKTVTVTVGTSFAVTAVGSDICEGETATITAAGADTYIWQPGNLTGATVQVTPLTTTTYTVTGSSSNANCPGTAVATALINVGKKAIVNVTDVITCAEAAVKLTGSISGGVSTGTWLGGTGTFSPDRNTPDALYTPSAAEVAAGTVVLTLESAEPQRPCTKESKQLTITIAPIPVPTAGADQVVCEGSPVKLDASIGGSVFVSMWNGGQGTFTPSRLDPKATYTPTQTEETTGKVSLIFTASDPSATCPGLSDTMNIRIDRKTIVSTGDPVAVCAGTAIKLNGSVFGAGTATWTGGGGNYIPDNTDPKAVYQPTASEIAAGKVTLVMIPNTIGVCPVDSPKVTHLIHPNPIVQFSADKPKDCAPHCVTFFDSTTAGNTAIATWEWDFGNGKTGQGRVPPEICYDQPGIYNVKLKAISDKKCASAEAKVGMIETFRDPVAQFTADPNPASVFDPVIHFYDQSTNDVNQWIWDFGDGQILSPDKKNPLHRYLTEEGENYTVKLLVINANGCKDSTYLPIEIEPFYAFYIPNAFTPDADGVNDTFRGRGVGIAEYKFWIFDRWGNLIFQADDINKGWDGTFKNEVVQQDVYVWKVDIKDIFGKKHTYTGTATVVK